MFLKVFALQHWSCALFLTYFGDHALLLPSFSHPSPLSTPLLHLSLLSHPSLVSYTFPSSYTHPLLHPLLPSHPSLLTYPFPFSYTHFPLSHPSLPLIPLPSPCNPLLHVSSRDIISRQRYLSPLWSPCILGGTPKYESYFLGDDERLKPNSGSGTLAAVAPRAIFRSSR